MKKAIGHHWEFVQTSGLVQVKLNSIEDVLHLRELDPKLWTALACPVKGLEFSEETLDLLDTDKNGRVRINEILDAVDYIKKYFKRPGILMEEGDSIPLDALSDEKFACGHSPAESAASVLQILNKSDSSEITLEDISVNDNLISPEKLNGDGVLPPEYIKDENAAEVAREIIKITGGADDISGVKGFTRAQKDTFFDEIRAIRNWREESVQDAPKVFFLKEATDAAAKSFMKLKDKINDYFLRCSLIRYDLNAQEILKEQTNKMFLTEDGELADAESLAKMPLAYPESDRPLPLNNSVNPIWYSDILEFKKYVILPIFQKDIPSLQETHWRKIEELFAPYVNWYTARPQNSASEITLDRIVEILNSNAEEILTKAIDEEENHPPVAAASVELKKMLLLRRDFLNLLRNFVSFSDFYDLEKKSIFQAGTLYLDGRSYELCFKVLDEAKHSVMASLSQCYLLYCNCTNRANAEEKMQIAALVSAGSSENLMVGRNGVFYDRKNQDWDATVTRIIENPVSVGQAFWSPYKRLGRMVQEKVTKMATDAEENINSKMSQAVSSPKNASATLPKKKMDIGTVAAFSVAISGITGVLGTIFSVLFDNVKLIPFVILAMLLIISLPSIFIAWTKLRNRNIAPILDASGWAINGNVKISTTFGSVLTHSPERPARAFIAHRDPFENKKFPIKRTIFFGILAILAVLFVIFGIKYTFPVEIKAIGDFFKNLFTVEGAEKITDALNATADAATDAVTAQ